MLQRLRKVKRNEAHGNVVLISRTRFHPLVGDPGMLGVHPGRGSNVPSSGSVARILIFAFESGGRGRGGNRLALIQNFLDVASVKFVTNH